MKENKYFHIGDHIYVYHQNKAHEVVVKQVHALTEEDQDGNIMLAKGDYVVSYEVFSVEKTEWKYLYCIQHEHTYKTEKACNKNIMRKAKKKLNQAKKKYRKTRKRMKV